MSPKQRDQALWESLRRGSAEALSSLFVRYADELFSYGMLLCGDQFLVEDSIQNLFLRLWQKRETLNPVTAVKGYLFVALSNTVRDHYRKEKNLPSFSLSIPNDLPVADPLLIQSSSEEEWIRKEQLQLQRSLLQQWLDALPERMQQAIYLRYSSGLNYAEISEVMGIQPQTAANLVHRASKKLRRYSARFTERLLFFLACGMLLFWC